MLEKVKKLFWAFANDIFQRIITLNKIEQRKNLRQNLKKLSLPPHAQVLDFGCGTALFAPTVLSSGYHYTGYDIDPAVVGYASLLYPKGQFVFKMDSAKNTGSFDLIIINCCSHHIDNENFSKILAMLKTFLKPSGQLLFIDILLAVENPSFLLRQFRKLERGAFVRSIEDYRSLLQSHFKIENQSVERSHVFSLKGNPMYNDLVVLTCK